MSAARVVALIQFARSTRARSVAEGIETQAEHDTLTGLGIRLGQGYLLGPPMRVTPGPDPLGGPTVWARSPFPA